MLQEGYSRYSCDVSACSRAKYAKPGSSAAAEYVTRTYIDQEGQEISQMLCKEHAAGFDQIVTRHVSELQAYMNTGAEEVG